MWALEAQDSQPERRCAARRAKERRQTYGGGVLWALLRQGVAPEMCTLLRLKAGRFVPSAWGNPAWRDRGTKRIRCFVLNTLRIHANENRSGKTARVLRLGVSHAANDGSHSQLWVVSSIVNSRRHVASVDAFRLRRIAGMRDLSLASGTFPRHSCTSG